MKKYIVILTIGFICLASHFFCYFSTLNALYLISDVIEQEMPINFRMISQGSIRKAPINLQRLEILRASGSGQFSEDNFIMMLRHLLVRPEQLIIIDLRQESHGFINGKPVSWTDGNYNYGNLHKSRSEVEADERERLRLARQVKSVLINPVKEPKKLQVYSIKTERNFVENHGIKYFRFPVTDRNRPTSEVVDQLIDLVKNLPSDAWVHFHCKAGKGRTTTFLTLLDIMKNAQYVSLEDILMRQQWIGGNNLNETRKKDLERQRAASERLELIRRFYLYCRQNPQFQVSWSVWNEHQ